MKSLTSHIRQTGAALTLAMAALVAGPTMAQEQSEWSYLMPEAVKSAMEKGQHSVMTPYLGASVELLLPNGSGIFGKKQAEMLIGDFLANHGGLTYKVDHEEKMGNSTMTIGVVENTDTRYRIYVLTQQVGDKQQIKQLKIEEHK